MRGPIKETFAIVQAGDSGLGQCRWNEEKLGNMLNLRCL